MIKRIALAALASCALTGAANAQTQLGPATTTVSVGTVAIMAALMVVLILIAAFVVTRINP